MDIDRAAAAVRSGGSSTILYRMYRSSDVVNKLMNRSKSIFLMTTSSNGRPFLSVNMAWQWSASALSGMASYWTSVIGNFRGYCLGMSTLQPTPLATLPMLHLALVV